MVRQWVCLQHEQILDSWETAVGRLGRRWPCLWHGEILVSCGSGTERVQQIFFEQCCGTGRVLACQNRSPCEAWFLKTLEDKRDERAYRAETSRTGTDGGRSPKPGRHGSQLPILLLSYLPTPDAADIWTDIWSPAAAQAAAILAKPDGADAAPKGVHELSLRGRGRWKQ